MTPPLPDGSLVGSDKDPAPLFEPDLDQRLRTEFLSQRATIADSQRERVFSPFYRLAGDANGAGLGLALVRQIARLHGGEVMVAPHPMRSSCFRVSLPMPASGA